MAFNGLTLPPPPTIPTLTGFNPPTGNTQPFSASQVVALQSFASALTTTNPSVITGGTLDLFNTETVLQGKGLSLSQFIADWQNLDKTLAITAVIGSGSTTPIVSGTSAIAVLNALVTDPQTFIGAEALAAYPGLSSLATIVGYLPDFASLDTLFKATASIGSGIFRAVPSGASAITVLTELIQDPFTFVENEVYAVFPNIGNLLGLYNNLSSIVVDLAALNLPGGYSFNNGALSGTPGSIVYSGGSVVFPSKTGDNLTTFLQSLITMVNQPGTVVAETLMAPTAQANLSVAGAMYNFLNGQTGGSSGANAQSYLQPLVNVLFGTNPGSSGKTNALNNYPGGTPFSLIWNILNPDSTSLTPGNGGGFTAGPISIQNLVKDGFGAPSVTAFAQDIYSLIEGIAPVPAKPAFSGQRNPFQVLTDLMNMNTFINVPGDIMSMVDVNNLLAQVGLPGGFNVVTLLSWFGGLMGNATQLGQDWFTGSPMGTPSGGFGGSVDHVYWTGSAYSTTGVINGVAPALPGRLGFALASAWTSLDEGLYLTSNISTSMNNFVNDLIKADAADALKIGLDLVGRLIDGLHYNSAAMAQVIYAVMQLQTVVQNISGLLNANLSIPGGPSALMSGSFGSSINNMLQNSALVF